MEKNSKVAPVLKWAGGKRQLLADIKKHLPSTFATYYEPFVGGGAVFFHLQPSHAVINDANAELINVYRVIKHSPLKLIKALQQHKNDAEYFYQLRALDRNAELYDSLTAVEKASRLIFLNRTCFNGLFRVNASGQFNVPFGYYKNPKIVNETTIGAIHAYFSQHDIDILNTDFAHALTQVSQQDFVYFDPPYDPVSQSSSFTSYTHGGFNHEEQQRLKQVCDDLTARGVRFLLSNSATAFIQDLYRDYDVLLINAKRAINSKADGRGAVSEVLVKNYANTSC